MALRETLVIVIVIDLVTQGNLVRLTNSSFSSNPVHYSSVDTTGTQNNVGYISTDIELMTLHYNFQEMMPVPLCYYYLQPSESNEYDCPGDGSYGFSVNYVLPSAGAEVRR